ncbi:hypothetical protein L204_103373 [Cryptococcus depauperatus]|nr:hypothetical protein L204_01691 [Cryptococcus depauperatus CBS 7855]
MDNDSCIDTADLDAEIAQLEAKRAARLAKAEKIHRAQEEEKANILVNATPTKASLKEKIKNQPLSPAPSQPKLSLSKSKEKSNEPLHSFNTTQPSKLSLGLAAMRQGHAPHRSEPPHATSRVFYSQSSEIVTKASKEPSKPKFGQTSSSVTQNLSSLPLEIPSSMNSGVAALKRRNSLVTDAGLSQGQLSHSIAHDFKTSRRRKKSQSPGSPLEVEDRLPNYKRDDIDSTLVEELELGPKEFGQDLEGEGEWLSLEPNSGIRLRKRLLAHDEVQDFLTDRYYIPPSKLYSVVRLSRDGTSYDIPVDKDWVTIAVIAQRSPIRVSGTKVKTAESSRGKGNVASKDDASDASNTESEGREESTDTTFSRTKVEGVKRKQKTKNKDNLNQSDKDDWKKNREPRKYINLTLCALPRRNYNVTMTAGDSLLQLLLFEADCVVSTEDEDGEVVKSYRGGSGGAYEKWCNLAEGSVIAIMNPRIWRNLKGGTTKPHPMTSPLGINPISDDSIIHIGHASDLGRCSAIQRDGNRCWSWVDLRLGQVCEYHVHAAVKRGRSGRGEFTASTSSYSLTSAQPAQHQRFLGSSAIGPRTKRGFLPTAKTGTGVAPRWTEDGGGATYIVSGGVVKTGGSSFGLEDVSSRLGRNRAKKRRRQEEQQKVEENLELLFEREKGIGGSTAGWKYLEALRKTSKTTDKYQDTESNENEIHKRVFSAEAIRKIGHDPSAKKKQFNKEEEKKRWSALADLKELSSSCRMEKALRVKQMKQNSKNVKGIDQVPLIASQTENSTKDDMIDLD